MTPPPQQATPPYRLLLAEQEAAQLRISSWVGEAEDGPLGRSLATLCHLVGRSSAPRRLLIGRHGRSHGHLESVGEKVLSGAETSVPRLLCAHWAPGGPLVDTKRGRTSTDAAAWSCMMARGVFLAPCYRKENTCCRSVR